MYNFCVICIGIILNKLNSEENMDEIEYKLSQNNAVLVVQAITKLMNSIKLKKSQSSTDRNDINFIELQFLKSKCGFNDPVISTTASHGIVSLVEDGTLPIAATLSDLMVLLTTAKCYSGITMAIGNLLLLDLRRYLDNHEKYKCPYNIQKPQHPLITILSQNSEIWHDIYNQIQFFMNHYDDRIAVNSIELLRPVFLYALCDPHQKLMPTFRKQLLSLLNSNIKNSETRLFIFEILSWSQLNSRPKCLELCEFLIELSKYAIQSGNSEISSSLIIYLTSLLYKLVETGCDPTSCIAILIELLEIPKTSATHSVALFILADIISISSSVYLKEVLRLTKTIVCKQSANLVATKSVAASILQWLLYPSSLLTESIKYANEILLYIENNRTYISLTGDLCKNIYFQYIQFSDPKIYFIFKLCLLAEKWQTNHELLTSWLNEISNYSVAILFKLYSILTGLFVNEFNDSSIALKLLEILKKFVVSSNKFAPKILVLILHKLSYEKDPETQVALFKAIPMMAVSKQNIPLIINTLETSQNSSSCFKTFTLDLYLHLWLTEVRCFPYLQKLLLEPDTNWEFNVTKAYTLKEICMRRPELHGKEMVLHLSKILNQFGDERGSVIAALAIDGITALCQASVVDVISTWKNIAPRFANDSRRAVVKSLCNFFAEYSHLDIKISENEKAVNDIISILWQYVSCSQDVEIISAALRTLANFDPGQIPLELIPDVYRQDFDTKSDHAFPYIPGVCWVLLLENTNNDLIDETGDLLIKWIRKEIASYKSSVYRVVEGRTEPVNYNYLPEYSIVRAVGHYLYSENFPKSKLHYSEIVLKQCFRILSASYCKPLPPLNWCFLHELLHKNAEISRLCINLACKQIVISGSARRLIDNYISVFEPDDKKCDHMLILFSNLSNLCKVLIPNTLRPMINKCLTFSFQKAMEENTDNYYKQLLGKLVEEIKIVLKNGEIQEANKDLLGEIIEEFVEQMSSNDEIFEIVVQCIIELNSPYLERLSSPLSRKEATQEKFEKALKVCCAVAIKNEPAQFTCLNECINTAATLPSVQTYTLNHINQLFRIQSQNSSISDWLLELMGRIQQKLTNNDSDMEQITFLCNVFIVAVVTFAGYDVFQTETGDSVIELFPVALLALVNGQCQRITLQITEWLFHMMDVSFVYQMTFYQSLVTLRYEKIFLESSRWMKYVAVKRPNL